MNNFSTRIRLIFVPFLVIAISYIAVYTFLDYIFVILMEIPVNDELVHYWLAVGLIWIPLLIWLRPRIKLLTLKDQKGNMPFVYQLIAGIAIMVPTIVAQNYLTTATGKLTTLNKISGINRQPLTKYFELKKYFIDKKHIAVYSRAEVSGKNNEYLNFYIDVVCPILDDKPKTDSVSLQPMPDARELIVIDGRPADSSMNVHKLKPSDIASVVILKGPQARAIYGAAAKFGAILIKTKRGLGQIAGNDAIALPQAWLGMEFNEQMSNNLSRDEEDSKFRSFASATDTEFMHRDLDNFIYLDRIGATDRHRAYLKAISRKYGAAPGKPVIFEAVNEPFEARNGGKLGWIFKSFGVGALVWLIMIIIPKLNMGEIDKLPGNSLAAQLDASLKAAQVFSNKSKFQVTAIIITINVFVFLAMVFSGLGFLSFEAPDLVRWGGNLRSLTTQGQWWRLLTSTFMHEGLMHLLLNMYGLVFAAIFVEPALGKLRYALTYLLCGILASAASIWWHDDVVAVGASGAIFGLYGVLVALLTTNRIGLKKKSALLIFSLVFIGLNLLMGLKGNTDNAAHIGGLLAGLLLGYFISFFGGLPGKEDMSDAGGDDAGLTEAKNA